MDTKKVYMPQSPVPLKRGITGYKDFHGNLVIVDRITGKPIEATSDEVTTTGRNKKGKPTKKGKPKAVITSQPDNAAEKDGSGGQDAIARPAGDVSNL